jgi:hypothetical protein
VGIKGGIVAPCQLEKPDLYLVFAQLGLGQLSESKDGILSLFSITPGVGAQFKFSKFENERRDPVGLSSPEPGTWTISGYPVS